MQQTHSFTGPSDFYRQEVAICVCVSVCQSGCVKVCVCVCVAAGEGDLDEIFSMKEMCLPDACPYTLSETPPRLFQSCARSLSFALSLPLSYTHTHTRRDGPSDDSLELQNQRNKSIESEYQFDKTIDRKIKVQQNSKIDEFGSKITKSE